MFLPTAQSSRTILFLCISSANKHSKLSRTRHNSLQKRCMPSRFLEMNFALRILQVPIKTLACYCDNSFPLGVGLLKFAQMLCLSNETLDPGPSVALETDGMSLPCTHPWCSAKVRGGAGRQSTSLSLCST